MQETKTKRRESIAPLLAMLVFGGAIACSPIAAADCGGCAANAERKEACGCRHSGDTAGRSPHDNIQTLLDRHDAVKRRVREVEGGVETVTTSDDPQVTRTIREHVHQMDQRLKSGQGVRRWDPLFVEIFRNHDKIEMRIEEIPGGVRVIETSADPEVVKLIRQHAIRGVSEFVTEGRTRASRPSALPDGYRAPADPPQPRENN